MKIYKNKSLFLTSQRIKGSEKTFINIQCIIKWINKQINYVI